MSFWNETEIERASQMWRDGRSARQIATAIGCSRSAVMGIAFRLRDRFPERKPGGRTKARINQMTPSRPTKPVRETVPSSVFSDVSGARSDLGRFRLHGQEPVAFADLDKNQCRFPLTSFDAASGPDMPCCGQVVDQDLSPYCSAHRAVSAGRVA